MSSWHQQRPRAPRTPGTPAILSPAVERELYSRRKTPFQFDSKVFVLDGSTTDGVFFQTPSNRPSPRVL
jgi:hypothetical protein